MTLPRRSESIRSTVSEWWYRSRIYLAWCNRCLICLLKPYHGKDST